MKIRILHEFHNKDEQFTFYTLIQHFFQTEKLHESAIIEYLHTSENPITVIVELEVADFLGIITRVLAAYDKITS